jgi:hypothetical protein
MKKILILAALLVSTAVSFAQGTVTFANNTATAITNVSSGSAPYPRAVVNVALYGSTSLGLLNDSSLTLVGAVTNTLPTGGIFIGGTRFIGAEGSTVTLQVRAWSGAFATYEAALAAALVDGTTLVGKSGYWEQSTGGGPNPAQPITGVGRLTPFTVNTALVIPEPSSIALGLLGLGAIALFRRKK